MIQWQPRFRDHQQVSSRYYRDLRECHISVLYVAGMIILHVFSEAPVGYNEWGWAPQ